MSFPLNSVSSSPSFPKAACRRPRRPGPLSHRPVGALGSAVLLGHSLVLYGLSSALCCFLLPHLPVALEFSGPESDPGSLPSTLSSLTVQDLGLPISISTLLLCIPPTLLCSSISAVTQFSMSSSFQLLSNPGSPSDPRPVLQVGPCEPALWAACDCVVVGAATVRAQPAQQVSVGVPLLPACSPRRGGDTSTASSSKVHGEERRDSVLDQSRKLCPQQLSP